MNKAQDFYLSELFLKTLNGDFSLESIKKALKRCDEEIIIKSDMNKVTMGVIRYFIRFTGLNWKAPKNMQQELLDFRDVYGEFDEMLTKRLKNNYFVLHIV